MPLIQKHHILLSTLLIGNALALESLPIFLEAVLPASAAIVVSTVLVVIFSEILPQALCTGPKQMKIAENMAGLMKVIHFLYIFIGKIEKMEKIEKKLKKNEEIEKNAKIAKKT